MEPVDLKQIWACEGCGCAYLGASPPDKCDMCDHAYFENLKDLSEEDASKAVIH